LSIKRFTHVALTKQLSKNYLIKYKANKIEEELTYDDMMNEKFMKVFKFETTMEIID